MLRHEMKVCVLVVFVCFVGFIQGTSVGALFPLPSIRGPEFIKLCEESFKAQDKTYTDILWGNSPECKNKDQEKLENKDIEKLLVVAPHTNAHLIKLQKTSLDMFLTEPFEYVVYDDSYAHAHKSNWDIPDTPALIEKATLEVHGRYKRVPQSFHEDRRCLFPNTTEPYENNPNTRCSDIYQFILRDSEVYCTQRTVLYIDADVFLVSTYSPTASMREMNVSVTSVKQHRQWDTQGLSVNMTYMWTAVNVMNMNTLPGKHAINWDCGKFPILKDTPMEKTMSIDSGGHTFEWLIQYSPQMAWLDVKYVHDSTEDTWKWFTTEWAELYKKNKLYELEFKSQILGNRFLHLRNAGNWLLHGKRYKWLQPAQAGILSELFQKRKEEGKKEKVGSS